jgi:hypothetical protein
MKTPDRKPTPKQQTQDSTEPTRRSATTQGHPLDRARPEERAHPSLRKAKHKHSPGGDAYEDNDDSREE